MPLSTQEYKWVPTKLLGKPNKLQGNELRLTSIPSGGSRNTPSRFMLQKPGISSSSYEPVGSKASFFFFMNWYLGAENMSSQAYKTRPWYFKNFRRAPASFLYGNPPSRKYSCHFQALSDELKQSVRNIRKQDN